MKFQAQRESWPYTFRGVKILTVLGQAAKREKNRHSSDENKENVQKRWVMTMGLRMVTMRKGGGTACLQLSQASVFE